MIPQAQADQEQLAALGVEIRRLGHRRMLWHIATVPIVAAIIALLVLIGPSALMLIFLVAAIRIWADRRADSKVVELTDLAQAIADDLDHVDPTQRAKTRGLEAEIGRLCRERTIWQWLLYFPVLMFFSGFGFFAVIYGTWGAMFVASVIFLMVAIRIAVVSRGIRLAERELKSIGARLRHRFRYPF